ncbi:MAG: signal peptidase I [Clostridia bacterium]|nr:signal peptidase I [Clostridia bacterium]
MNSRKQTAVKSSLIETVFDLLEIAMYALVLVAVLFAFFVRIVEVDGPSMNNTLSDGDRLVLSKAFYSPERGDIVVIKREGNNPLIKRVIGLENETVMVDRDKDVVYIDGHILDEPYVEYPNTPGLKEPVVVPPGHVFVLGDHRNNSTDSRVLGCIPVEDILGKAVLRFFPFDQFGTF